MATWRFHPILILVVLGIAWLVTSIRVARMARHYGRSPRRWFVITLCCSAIPAVFVFWWDYRNRVTAGNSLAGFRRRRRHAKPPDESEDSSARGATPFRCPHCGAILEQADHTTGIALCPHCQSKLDEGFFA